MVGDNYTKISSYFKEYPQSLCFITWTNFQFYHDSWLLVIRPSRH